MLKALHTFAQGQSYWRVVLRSGKVISELDMVHDSLRGALPRGEKDPQDGRVLKKLFPKHHRSVNWYLDIVGGGDAARIDELWICTPKGDAALRITEPYSAYQFQAGVLTLQGRMTTAQIIGRVDDKLTGRGVAFIWDVTTQQLYKDEEANVLSFGAWRPGIARPGALALPVIGVRL